MLRIFALSLALAAGPAVAQAMPQAGPKVVYAPSAAPTAWNPTAAYVTPGQDEPGYRNWYARALWHEPYVKAFNDYLESSGVGGVVPTWQLLRTASSWKKCGSQPFEVPPTEEWPHIVQTLRYIRDYVVPAVGPVETVSGYRNPHLNVCAGGAPASAHKTYSAIDLVPLQPTTREQLMRTLCAVHADKGSRYGVGLGFYAYLRFHVDTLKYRRWGASGPDCPAIIRPEDAGTVAQPLEPPPIATAPVDSAVPAASAATTAAATAPGTAEPRPNQKP